MLTEDEGFETGSVSLLWAYPEQSEKISSLHSSLFDDGWSKDSIHELLTTPSSTAFVATYERPGNVVGFVIARLIADEGEILSVGVCKDCQSHGIGKRLVLAVMRIMQRAEAEKVYLEVAEDNAAARGLYQSLGFEEVGRRAGYYNRGNGETADALTLSHVFQPTAA
jgi:[ribosomal protein S18]-alanine N-acetyltransferase